MTDILPFQEKIISIWGEIGKQWLQNLPQIIKRLSQHWHLSNLNQIKKLNYNYVALAIQRNNVPVVLKISCDKQLIQNEYNALRHFNGQGSVRVLDTHMKFNSLLLEQANPGNTLKDRYINNIQHTIKIYSDIVKQISTCPTPSESFPHMKEWCAVIDNLDNKIIKQNHIDKAKELKEYLLSSTEAEYLCHGDLHLENIIQQNEQWISIDPKGILGELAFEAAGFDLIDKSDWDNPDDISTILTTRASLLAKNLDLDQNRLLSWVYLRALISAQWFIEDNNDPSDALCLANVIYPMLTKHYHKKNVWLSYDIISDWYKEQRNYDLIEQDYLEIIIQTIPSGGNILDLGCGTGQPIAEYFIQHGFDVTGVDGSQAQITKASQLVPKMHTICEDMRHICLAERFDCIIAWHSFFHLSQDDQRNIFKIFKQHIKPGGLLVFTSGPSESEVWGDNNGEMLYHASLSVNEYTSLLNSHGFTLIKHTIEDPNCGNATVWIAEMKVS